MKDSTLPGRRRLQFLAWCAALGGVGGLVGAAILGWQGDRGFALGLGYASWILLMVVGLNLAMSRDMMSSPYGLLGSKVNRPFPPEFARPPDCAGGIIMAETFTGGRGGSFWFGPSGVGMQFGGVFLNRNLLGVTWYQGPRVFLPREHLVAIVNEGWWSYRVDHRNPELRSSFWIHASIAARFLSFFPEHDPSSGPLPSASTSKSGH